MTQHFGSQSAFGSAFLHALNIHVPAAVPARVVARDGTHGLHCRRSWGRHPRHTSINDAFKRALSTAHIPARREPIGLFNNQLKPDGITLVTWRKGRYAAWDVTVVDTLAPAYVAKSARRAGSAAYIAEGQKRHKYRGLPAAYEFFPLAFETLGSMGKATSDFVRDLCGRLRDPSGDRKAGPTSVSVYRWNSSVGTRCR